MHAFVLNDWKPHIFTFFHPAFELICSNWDRAVAGIVHRQVGNARSCNLYCWAFTNTVKEIRVIPPRLSGKLGSDLQTQNWYKIYFPRNRRNNLPPFMLQWEKLCLGRGNRIVCCWCAGGTAASARRSWMWSRSPGEFSRYVAPEILTAGVIWASRHGWRHVPVVYFGLEAGNSAINLTDLLNNHWIYLCQNKKSFQGTRRVELADCDAFLKKMQSLTMCYCQLNV